MAGTRKLLASTVDMAHLISAGVPASVCRRETIDEAFARTGKAGRHERLLPAGAVIDFKGGQP